MVKPQGQVLEGFRSMIANRLSRNGKHWTKIFARRNSGTYNNQWMVIDYKRFKPSKPLPKQGKKYKQTAEIIQNVNKQLKFKIEM